MELFENNKVFHASAIVRGLFSTTINQELIHEHKYLWIGINHVIDALLLENGVAKSTPVELVNLDAKHKLSERIVHRLLIIKWQLRVTRQVVEHQNTVSRTAILTSALWLLVGLWHELYRNAAHTLTSFQETILIDEFRNMISATISTAIQNQQSNVEERRRLLIMKDRLFSTSGQHMRKVGIAACFHWKIRDNRASVKSKQQDTARATRSTSRFNSAVSRSATPPAANSWDPRRQHFSNDQRATSSCCPGNRRSCSTKHNNTWKKSILAQQARIKANNTSSAPMNPVGIARAKTLDQGASRNVPRNWQPEEVESTDDDEVTAENGCNLSDNNNDEDAHAGFGYGSYGYRH
jgi:hypothetical protein